MPELNELEFKYVILRHAIVMGKHFGGKSPYLYNRDELRVLCHEIENKSIKQLKQIYEIWMGYPHATHS